MRRYFFIGFFLVIIVEALFFFFKPVLLYSLVVVLPIALIGFYDALQTRHTIRRNYPILGNFRYLFESIRPEINQYFVESDTNGTPLNREERDLIYTRSKNVRDTIPFGTKKDTYAIGYEWINHSILSNELEAKDMRVLVGEKSPNPYSASLLNISAMSYGSLSDHAVLALNRGAEKGAFAHNTGEGSISPYHMRYGGDLVWQIGTGYFGCRHSDGTFDEGAFAEKSQLESVKMIELKVSQGAKPGHGGILPRSKITPEIAKIRNVSLGEDVISPPYHSSFSTPIEMMEFIGKLKSLSKKPVGFKFCLGRPSEFASICKAMLVTNIRPDFIVVDGGEGGTGAAPVEFSNALGTPLYDALPIVTNLLTGFDLKKDIKVFASGRLTSAFGIIKRICLGADMIYSARAFMLSLGCIQALKCNSNTCPTGVATQDRGLIAGLVVEDKYERVYNFHKQMIRATCDLIGAMGLSSTSDLKPYMIKRRMGLNEIKNYSEIYDFIETGSLLGKSVRHPTYKAILESAEAERFKTQKV